MASSCSRACALPTACARPFDWQLGRAQFSRGSGPESREQPLHTTLAAILIAVGHPVQCSHTASLLKGLKFQVRGLSMRPLRASETRLSTKEKGKKRFYI